MNMKKISVYCLAGVASLCFMELKNNKNNLHTELALSNIEALAQNEDDKNYDCIGTGCVDCPVKRIKVVFIREY